MARKPRMLTVVANANKMARIVQSDFPLLRCGGPLGRLRCEAAITSSRLRSS